MPLIYPDLQDKREIFRAEIISCLGYSARLKIAEFMQKAYEIWLRVAQYCRRAESESALFNQVSRKLADLLSI